MNTITGNDVIGIEGQHLTHDELKTLVGLADGDTPSQMQAALNTDVIGLRQLERNLKLKLGAKTKTHIISRGFVTGVLMTRALCLLLASVAVMQSTGSEDFMRTRTRIRTTRTVRTNSGQIGRNLNA